VVVVTFGVACVAMAIPYIPKINKALQMTPPEPIFYSYLVGIILTYACVIHVVKSLYQRAFKEWL
jgi:Mg2+-importing ATPase